MDVFFSDASVCPCCKCVYLIVFVLIANVFVLAACVFILPVPVFVPAESVFVFAASVFILAASVFVLALSVFVLAASVSPGISCQLSFHLQAASLAAVSLLPLKLT